MKHTGLFLGFVTGILFASQSSNAQYTADFQTNIISGVTSNWTGEYYVGNTNFADVLLIQTNGVLFNSISYMGYQISSSNNSAVVTGTGSVWSSPNVLFVGDRGAGNQLTILNGGRVFGGVGDVGGFFSSSNNMVLVSGSGSVWSNSSSLFMGDSGGNNQLIVTNGGAVFSGNTGYLGYSFFSSNNVATVTGSGSVWSNGVTLQIGNFSSNNKLKIADGGTVYVRLQSSMAGNRNMAIVTGGGSIWTSGENLNIGQGGAGNSLVISNGGQVFNGFGNVGFDGNSSNNSVVVSGSGSVWSNQSVFVGSQGAGNTLLISNGAQVIDGSASNVKLGGFIGEGASSSGNTAVVTGSGSLWKNIGGGSDAAGGITIGDLGAWNRLIVSDGASVLGARGVIGALSNSNAVRVIGGGIWQNIGLFVGINGSSNSLVIADGFVSATNVVVGVASAACDNLIQLDSGSMIVTNASANATFEVRNGKLILNGGVLQVDRFVMTNACAQFIRTGGTLIYGTAVLDPNRDDDGDGVPNGWELSHGRDPLNAADVNADTDGDGQTDLAEFQAGTDPTNSASAFRIVAIAPDGDDIMITWTTVGGKKYAVQFADGAYTNGFTEFEPIIIAPGTGESTFSVIDPGAVTNGASRFYRVRLVL